MTTQADKGVSASVGEKASAPFATVIEKIDGEDKKDLAKGMQTKAGTRVSKDNAETPATEEEAKMLDEEDIDKVIKSRKCNN